MSSCGPDLSGSAGLNSHELLTVSIYSNWLTSQNQRYHCMAGQPTLSFRSLLLQHTENKNYLPCVIPAVP